MSASRRRAVGDDEPDQPGSDDEPDDEQPPIELGVHRARSIGSAAGAVRGAGARPLHCRGCSTSPQTPPPSSSARWPIGWYGIGYAVGLAAAYLVCQARAPGGRGPRHPRQRDDRRGHRRAHRRPGVPRHRPVGSSTRRTRSRSSCRPIRGSASTAGSSRHDRGVPVRALQALPFRAGPTSSRPACSSCRRSRAGGTSSTRSSTAHPRPCRGASPSTAPIGCRRATRARSFPEATTRFHPLFLYESISGLARRAVLIWLGRRSGTGSDPATSC